MEAPLEIDEYESAETTDILVKDVVDVLEGVLKHLAVPPEACRRPVPRSHSTLQGSWETVWIDGNHVSVWNIGGGSEAGLLA